MIRAGGHVIRESGWEPEQAAPAPEPAGEPAELSVAGPDRAECPGCGKPVPLKKDGTLRKHTCVIEAPPPEITFDDQDGDSWQI